MKSIRRMAMAHDMASRADEIGRAVAAVNMVTSSGACCTSHFTPMLPVKQVFNPAGSALHIYPLPPHTHHTTQTQYTHLATHTLMLVLPAC